MLETVTKGFRAAKNRLVGKVEITPELIDELLRDIRVSLLEADVAFDVVKKFVAQVREKAAGEVVKTTITDKIQWLSDAYKLTPSEVAQVLGTAAEYKVSQVADRNAGIVLKINKQRLQELK